MGGSPISNQEFKFPIDLNMHTNGNECNGCCYKRLQHVFAKIVDRVLGMKFLFDRRVKRRDDCHFSVYKKLNGLVQISFIIIRFSFDKKILQAQKVAFLDQLRMCFYQIALDVDSDYDGTHKINRMYMKVGINNKFS